MDHREVLPKDTVLDGKYRIERVLGAGGFGITYEATDIGLGMSVAVKEYFPAELAHRDQTYSIRPRSNKQTQLFDHLRSSFLREAQTLAQFDDPSIVRVISVFPAHGTAYMVMRYEVGHSMKSWLAQLERPPTQSELDQILANLLRALELMHDRNFLHRDIATDNIILRPDNNPVLLDFGSSRRVVSQATGALTGVVKQGYSPPEQYSAEGKTQGPWTDIYAMGATLYRCVTGRMPPEGTARMLEDDLVPSVQAAFGGYRQEFLEAIDWSLAVHPRGRPQNIRAWRPALFAGTALERSTFIDPSVQFDGEQFDAVNGGYSAENRSSPVSSRRSAPSQSRPSRNSQPSGQAQARSSSVPVPSKSNNISISSPGTVVAPEVAAKPLLPLAARFSQRLGGRNTIPLLGSALVFVLVGSMMLFGFWRGPGAGTAIAPQSQNRKEAAAVLPAVDSAKNSLAERQREEAERQRVADEQAKRLFAEAERVRLAEEVRRKAVVDAENQRAALERQRLAEEVRKRAEAEAERLRIAEIERQRLADIAKQQAEAEAARQRRAEAERLRLAEIERQRVADIARQQAEAEAERQRRAEAERLRLAEIDRQKAADIAKRQAEAEAERQRRAEAERLRLAEIARQKAAEIAKQQADAEAERRQKAEADRQRLAEIEQQKAAEAARRAAEFAAEQQRVAALDLQRQTEEARRKAETDAENKRLTAERQAEQKRRAVALNTAQILEFNKRVQTLLKEHNCYTGDINGNEAAVRQALEKLKKHDASGPQLALARATVGSAQDAIDWLDKRNRSICPAPTIDELNEQERLRKQQEADQTRTQKQKEAEQARLREQQQQKKAQDEQRARQQREQQAQQQRDAAAAAQRRASSGGGGGGSSSNRSSSSGNSGGGGGGSPRVSVPSF